MRLPLRRQILLPLLAIVAASVVGVSGAHIWLTAHLGRQAMEEQMRSVATTLNESTFPLETNVLVQVRGLSGADLAVVDPATGSVLAASRDAFRSAASDPPPQLVPQAPQAVTLVKTATVDHATYFYAVARLDRRASGGRELLLRLYYPERAFRAARWQAIYPSLLVGGAALVLAVALASFVAARVTQPVQRLKRQTERIAGGDFTPVQPAERDDELRDLALAVNRMAGMLSASTEQLREHERTATLHQIGAGIAHQLRNAATGCRMAIDLFRRQEPQWHQDENLQIATRQLELMEGYLQRFLILGRTAQPEKTTFALQDAVTSAVELVQPLANHLHVRIDAAKETSGAHVQADRSSLEQALVNLLTNAIEACAATPSDSPCVRVRVTMQKEEWMVQIADNGCGIAEQVRTRLGEPFVTSKPEGTGLGLAVAREILAQHGGKLAWRRADGWTLFEVRLPVAIPSAAPAPSP